MSDSVFRSFGQFSRPDIGLISDSFQNLSEIFDSDKREALRNILIGPENLDNIYEVHTDISREDLRSVSGLSRLLLPSLNQLSEVFIGRIPTRLFINKEFYNPDSPLGGVGSPGLKTPNVIIYNGSIRCRGASYRANTIGSSLFNNPLRQRVFLSSSRSSLFNTELDEQNPGYFESVTFSGSIRVRRRSHVNRIFVPRSTFLTRAPVVENPSHTIRLNVDNGNTGTESALKLLATKNSPLKIFCRMSSGSVRFTFSDSAAPYFYGYQIQPAQQRPNRPPVDFLPVTQISQTTGSTEFTLNIDITGTGYQNLYDLYLYLYLNPEKITGMEFTGIGIKETPDLKDLGLIGFNNLRSLRVNGGEISILPLWLKTLSSQLQVLDLSNSGDRWRSGPMGWFDIRDPSATPSFTHPLYTAVSYLTVPKTGPMVGEDGDSWSDPLFEKYILNQSRTANTDYRVFTAMRSLVLRDRFLFRSARFDDVFPGLTNLDLSRRPEDELERRYRYIFGDLPKINNNGNIISYNIFGSQAKGDIVQIGTSSDPEESGHISKYRFNSFNISGRFELEHEITGYINDPVEDWSAWRQNCVSINITRTEVEINLQDGEWDSLNVLSANFSEGIKFDNSSSVIKAPNLRSLSFFGSKTTGKFPSLGSNPVTETGSLETIVSGGTGVDISPVTDNGVDFLLPANFAPPRNPGSDHRLKSFSFGQSALVFRFRERDLLNLFDLVNFNLENSRFTGKFPIFPLKRLPEVETKSISIRINQSDFHDLSNLSVSSSNFFFSRDVNEIIAWNQNLGDGGCILPLFEGTSTSNLQVVNINNCLTSTYRNDWFVPALRGSCIKDEDPGTELSGLSISRSVTSQPENSVYTLTGGSGLRQRVLVNDSVRASLTGPELARVVSVSATEITLSKDIPGTLPSPLFFTRNTVRIENWFRTGFSRIISWSSRNNRLSGTLDIKNGFGSSEDSSVPAVDLSRNLITGYVSGSLSKIFSGRARKITVDLSSNNLDLESIRKIIEEVVTLDNLRKFNNCVIRLSGNKLTSDNKYSNYSQSEVFPVTVTPGNDVVTSLFRNETFLSYRIVTVTDQNGNSTDLAEPSGSRTLTVPGQLVSGQYFKTKRDVVQGNSENPLASQFKSLRGITVNLGFVYRSPSTGNVIVSTTYEDLTTRNQSITDSGLELLPSCPNGISGTCWRRPSDQLILQLSV
jgi:hypothetical protein